MICVIPGEPPARVMDLEVLPNEPGLLDVPIVFSALPSGPAKEIEPALDADIIGAYFTASDFTGDIHRYTFELAKACDRNGAVFHYGAQVTDRALAAK